MLFDYDEQTTWPRANDEWESPIDIDTTNLVPYVIETPSFGLRGLAVNRTDKTINVVGQGRTVIDGRQLYFNHLHFHCSGEHAVDGHRCQMEAHFVHSLSDGQGVVIAVPLQLGAANPVFERIVTQTNGADFAGRGLDLTALLPHGGDWYHYSGSLTTPPVRMGVAWYVAATPLTISADQLEAYHTAFPIDNHRQLQPINNRPIQVLYTHM